MKAGAEAVASPCTGACTLDAQTGFCIGCGRNMSEISAWPELRDDQKRRILALLPARLRRLETFSKTRSSR